MSARPNRQPPQVQPFDVEAAYAAFDAGIKNVVTDADTRRRAVKRGPQTDEDRRRSLMLDNPAQQAQGQPTPKRSYSDLSDDELTDAIDKARRLESHAQDELDNRRYAEALADSDARAERDEENEQALIEANEEFYEAAGSGAVTEPDGYVE